MAGPSYQSQPPPPNPYDLSGDPALQQILAADAAARANAQAAALASEKRLAIQLGDAKGIVDDKNTAAEAARNPYSTLASLLKSYGQQKTNTDETANKNNLYYSGARANALQQDAYGYQHNVYDARQNALNALAGIQQNLAGQLFGYNQADAAGYQQAYQNAASQSQQYGYDPGGSVGATPQPTNVNAYESYQATQPAAPSAPKGVGGVAAALSTPPVAMTSPAFRALAQARIPKAVAR